MAATPSEWRAEQTQLMARLRPLLWLPTQLLFRPAVWLLNRTRFRSRLLDVTATQATRRWGKEQPFGGYRPTEHDVFVCAFVKSGTNWMMQLAYQIAWRGAGDFDHVHDVIAWPEGMRGYAVPLGDDAARLASPTGLRIIKTHLPWDQMPYEPMARYLVVARDPKEIAVSAYHFARDTVLGPLLPSVDAFLDNFLSDRYYFGPWAAHLHSFWQQRHRPNVLFLTFREMKADPEGIARRVADFMGVPLTEAELARVREQSSFAHMKRINHKFYPNPLTPWSRPNGAMMRSGQVGQSGELLSPAQQRRIDDFFRAELQRLGSDFPYDAHFGRA